MMMDSKEKLGCKVAAILLFSAFILVGFVGRAYSQPLDSPLYNHTNNKAVDVMNSSTDANAASDSNGPVPLSVFVTLGKCGNCDPPFVPVMSLAGEVVFILTLTGGACWAILRKRIDKKSEG